MSISKRVGSDKLLAKVRLGVHMGYRRDVYLGTFDTREECEQAIAKYRARYPHHFNDRHYNGWGVSRVS